MCVLWVMAVASAAAAAAALKSDVVKEEKANKRNYTTAMKNSSNFVIKLKFIQMDFLCLLIVYPLRCILDVYCMPSLSCRQVVNTHAYCIWYLMQPFLLFSILSLTPTGKKQIIQNYKSAPPPPLRLAQQSCKQNHLIIFSHIF